jgi:hypothetical protein
MSTNTKSNSSDRFKKYVDALDRLDINPERVKATAHTSAVTVRLDEIEALMEESEKSEKDAE